MYDLIIRGGTLIDAHLHVPAEVAVHEGSIVDIAPTITGACKDEIDATGFFVFPGLIDPHVHFHEPSNPQWEGLYSGTRALAAGGVTTFFDMPFSPNGVTNSVEAVELKRHAIRRNAIVNGYVWGALTPDNLHELEKLHRNGVIGFKALMASHHPSQAPHVVDDYTLYEGMKIIAELGNILAIHAENQTLVQRRTQLAAELGKTHPDDYPASRPIVAELEAIERALIFARETGCKIHIAHVSSGRAVAALLRASAAGVNVTWETCPHYLVFTDEDMEWLNVRGKCAPPLRSLDDRALLWDYVLSGNVHMIASDHSPAPPEQRPAEDFFSAWAGIAACQETLRLLLTEGYHRRAMLLQHIAEITSYNAAQRFNLKTKGRLTIGADADLVLVDVEAADVLHPNDLHYQHKISPYIGMKLNGRIARTLIKGRTVYNNGTFG